MPLLRPASSLAEVTFTVKFRGKLVVNSVATIDPEILIDHVISLAEVYQDFLTADDGPLEALPPAPKRAPSRAFSIDEYASSNSSSASGKK